MKIFGIALTLVIFCSCKKYNVIHHGCTSPAVNERFDSGFLFMPNIFSPNDDGVNDLLTIYSMGVSSIYIKIHNNWGQVVFESSVKYLSPDSTYSMYPEWDGTFGGKLAPANNYHYVLDYSTFSGSSKSIKGFITLIRYNTNETDHINGVNCIDHYEDCVFSRQWNITLDSLIQAIQNGELTSTNCN